MRPFFRSSRPFHAVTAALALLLSAPGHAEEDPIWDKQTTSQTSVTGLGQVNYQISDRSVGFDHFATEIVIRWQQDQAAAEQQQVLYEGIHDRPPARIWGAGRHLCLAMQTCPRGSDRCQWDVLAYRYQAASQSFVEVKPSSTSCRKPR